MKIGNRTRKLLIIAVSLIVFLGIYTVAFQWYFGPPSMPDFYRQLSDEYQRESMKTIVESLDDDNAAKYYLLARLEMMAIPEGSFYNDACPAVSEGDSQESISELEDCVSAHEKAFDLVKEGINQDSYFLPAGDLLESSFTSTRFIRLARLMATKGSLQAHKGQFEEATETYIDQLLLAADIYNNSPFGESILAIGCEHGAYRGLESLLAQLNEEQCEELLRELVDIEGSRASLRQQLELGREKSVGFFNDGVRKAVNLGEPLIDPGPGDYFLDTMRRTFGYLFSFVLTGKFKREMDNFYRAMIEISEKPYPEILREPLEDRVPTGTFSGILLPALEKSFPAYASQEATRRGYILKVALRLRLLRHGEYPDNLDELSVRLPDQILIDPLSTNRFIYIKTVDGYLFYSFGVDLDDDGGKPDESLYDKNKDGDIVFEPPKEVVDSET